MAEFTLPILTQEIALSEGDLIREAMSVCDSTGEEEGGAEMGGDLRDFRLGAAGKDLVRCPRTDPGARVPGI